MPEGGNRLCGKRLTATLYSQKKYSARFRQTIFSRLFRKRGSSLSHPILQQIQAAHIAERLRRPIIFKNAGLSDDLFLLGKDDIDIKGTFLDQRFCKNVLRFIGGKPGCGLQELFSLQGRNIGLNLWVGAYRLDDSLQKA